MDVSGIQLKEAVELIESRIPGGKWLTRIALFLILAVVIIASVSYIWTRAVVPLAHIMTALITGTNFTIQITVGDVLIWIVLSLVTLAFGRLLSRTVGLMERQQGQAEGITHIVDRVIKDLERLTVLFDELRSRVITLEKG